MNNAILKINKRHPEINYCFSNNFILHTERFSVCREKTERSEDHDAITKQHKTERATT